MDDTNSELFCQKLKELTNLDNVLSSVKELCLESDSSQENEILMNDILSPFLNFIETITTLKMTK